MQNKSLRTEVYEIEAILAKQQFLSEIIRDFGEYNSENSEILKMIIENAFRVYS